MRHKHDIRRLLLLRRRLRRLLLLLLGIGDPYPQSQQQYGTDGGEGDRNLDARTAKTKRDQRTWRRARPCSRAAKRNIHAGGIPE